MTENPQADRLSTPLRVLTLHVAVTMAFALGFIFAFATKLQPHFVAISFVIVFLGSVYGTLLGIYLWFIQRRATGKAATLK